MLADLREDLDDRKAEEQRTRTRLHEIEGAVSVFTEAQKYARRDEERQYRRLELRLQWMMVVVTLATVVTPLAVLFLHSH